MSADTYEVEAGGKAWTERAWNPTNAAKKASYMVGRDAVIRVRTRVFGWRSYRVLGNRYVLPMGTDHD